MTAPPGTTNLSCLRVCRERWEKRSGWCVRRVWEEMTEGEDSGEEGAERGGECGCMLDVRGGIVDMADMVDVSACLHCDWLPACCVE